jgi:amino acid adenylation domain-containing protein
VVRCIHELVAEQAARTPERIAVSHGGSTLTYRQLDHQAEELARRLRAAGVGGGSPVAVVLERSLELIVALTGILKAGGAYLYLDPAEPAPQRARILRDAAAEFAVIGQGTSDQAPDVAHVLPVRAPGGPVAPAAGPSAPVTVDTPAYVCYTSGSTGEPKGVVVPHKAISRLVHDQTWMRVDNDDVFLQFTRVGFDVSTFEIWMPLVRGCRLAIAPPGPADLSELVETIRTEGVTVLWLTAGLFHKLVADYLDGLGSVRHLLAGGDVLSPSHVQRVLAAYPGLIFTNGYGPTENTTFTTCWTTRTSGTAPRVPVGVPVDGTTAMVLGDDMRLVPDGEVGELWVGGEGVALGYLSRPGATAEKFVADIDPARPGGRMYRTGDLARWAEDGTLDFLGRSDRQVKIRGYRVEPSTVEMELLHDPRVEQAAAFTQADGTGDVKLIAYVGVGEMSQDKWTAFSAALRERLRVSLPAYLVPWAVIVRPEIPLNPNGKVDRTALSSTKIPRNVWNDYVMPGDQIEHRLAAIWSDALDVEPVGVQDDFFELGGHSLMAAELLTALQQEFNVTLPARALYLRPTIADLAEELRRQGGGATLEETTDVPVQ